MPGLLHAGRAPALPARATSRRSSTAPAAGRPAGRPARAPRRRRRPDARARARQPRAGGLHGARGRRAPSEALAAIERPGARPRPPRRDDAAASTAGRCCAGSRSATARRDPGVMFSGQVDEAAAPRRRRAARRASSASRSTREELVDRAKHLVPVPVIAVDRHLERWVVARTGGSPLDERVRRGSRGSGRWARGRGSCSRLAARRRRRAGRGCSCSSRSPTRSRRRPRVAAPVGPTGVKRPPFGYAEPHAARRTCRTPAPSRPGTRRRASRARRCSPVSRRGAAPFVYRARAARSGSRASTSASTGRSTCSAGSCSGRLQLFGCSQEPGDDQHDAPRSG